MEHSRDLPKLSPKEAIAALLADATMTRLTMKILVEKNFVSFAQLEEARQAAIESFYRSSELTIIGSKNRLNPEQLARVAERSRMFISADSIEGRLISSEA